VCEQMRATETTAPAGRWKILNENFAHKKGKADVV
jgi:hypothetical protein